jgi:hypothetical protein
MIKTHEFNTEWWGSPVGIVTENRLFELPRAEREQLLQPYEWVEFKMPLEHSPVQLLTLHRAGFMQVDTQINYRLNLVNLKAPESLKDLEVEFADEHPFEIEQGDLKSFEHERYFKLPGITAERVNRRYALWCRQHLIEHPSACLRILYKGKVEGWYLGATSEGVGLNLTLAMLSGDADISGLLLFLRAYQAYASRGHRLGWASFSVQNTPVHNIYASIGARFLNPVGQWMWIR